MTANRSFPVSDRAVAGYKSRMRSLMLIPVALLLWSGAACSSDDDSGDDPVATTSTAAATDTSSADESATGGFCEAAGEFAVAQADAPDATGPDAVETTVTAMADTAENVAATAPQEVAADAEAFAAAIDGLRQYAADRDYEVDLGGAAPEYQSGEGQAVVGAINDTIGAVDQAVQDECGRFLNEVP